VVESNNQHNVSNFPIGTGYTIN